MSESVEGSGRATAALSPARTTKAQPEAPAEERDGEAWGFSGNENARPSLPRPGAMNSSLSEITYQILLNLSNGGMHGCYRAMEGLPAVLARRREGLRRKRLATPNTLATLLRPAKKDRPWHEVFRAARLDIKTLLSFIELKKWTRSMNEQCLNLTLMFLALDNEEREIVQFVKMLLLPGLQPRKNIASSNVSCMPHRVVRDVDAIDRAARQFLQFRPDFRQCFEW